MQLSARPREGGLAALPRWPQSSQSLAALPSRAKQSRSAPELPIRRSPQARTRSDGQLDGADFIDVQLLVPSAPRLPKVRSLLRSPSPVPAPHPSAEALELLYLPDRDPAAPSSSLLFRTGAYNSTLTTQRVWVPTPDSPSTTRKSLQRSRSTPAAIVFASPAKSDPTPGYGMIDSTAGMHSHSPGGDAMGSLIRGVARGSSHAIRALAGLVLMSSPEKIETSGLQALGKPQHQVRL